MTFETIQELLSVMIMTCYKYIQETVGLSLLHNEKSYGIMSHDMIQTYLTSAPQHTKVCAHTTRMRRRKSYNKTGRILS